MCERCRGQGGDVGALEFAGDTTINGVRYIRTLLHYSSLHETCEIAELVDCMKCVAHELEAPPRAL